MHGTTTGPVGARARELDARDFRFAARRSWRQFWNNQCTDLAAGMTYYGVLGVFPALIAIVSLLGLVGQGDAAVAALVDVANRAAPPVIADLVDPILRSLATSRSLLGVIVGTVGALYTVSRYTRAFGRALNRIYGVREGRQIVWLEARMVLVTLVLGALVTVIVALVVISGPVAELVGRIAGVGPTVLAAWAVLKWPAGVLVVGLIVAVLYSTTPNIRRPQYRWLSIGALLALVIWGLASVAFGVYVSNFSRFDITYGSLAGIIVFLIWLWVTNLAVLIGAVVDCELQRVRELKAGWDAVTDLHLELRDTRRTDKLDAKTARDQAEAAQIRDAARARFVAPGS